ncbi:hypothetical protein ACFOWE_17460 [Planomonospora corallina]|uniref:ABC transporter permease n=1 Tax=Planomonospora corallina TaxID=1806052 RepID=A0ABV8I886_9ACTN
MKPVDLWRHELRRAGPAALLGPAVLALLLGLLAVFGERLGSREGTTAAFLLGGVEAGVPLLAGVTAAWLPRRDPVTELRLTLPGGHRAAVLRRLALTTGWTALCALVLSSLLMAAGWWDHLPYGRPAGQLVWLAPALWLTALGLLAAAALRDTGAATTVVTAVWAAELLFPSLLDDPVLRAFHLFATVHGADAADWPVNRLVLLSTALPLAAAAWLLLGDAERVLRDEVR